MQKVPKTCQDGMLAVPVLHKRYVASLLNTAHSPVWQCGGSAGNGVAGRVVHCTTDAYAATHSRAVLRRRRKVAEGREVGG